MGTRGAIGVRIDGQDKIGYNHFDSYPSGVGVAVVSDIRELLETPDRFESLCRNLQTYNSEVPPTQEQVEALKQYADLDVSKQSLNDWYCLTRNLQGKLKATLEAGYIDDSQSFLRDSLFCEWAYIANLDDGVFEVYKGFQKTASPEYGRYSVTEPDHNGYVGVSLVAKFPLHAIPKDWVEQVDPSEDLTFCCIFLKPVTS